MVLNMGFLKQMERIPLKKTCQINHSFNPTIWFNGLQKSKKKKEGGGIVVENLDIVSGAQWIGIWSVEIDCQFLLKPLGTQVEIKVKNFVNDIGEICWDC